MKSVHLNPGGIIAGLALPVVTFLLIYGFVAEDEPLQMLVPESAVVGAIGGNFLWDKLRGAKRPPSEPPQAA